MPQPRALGWRTLVGMFLFRAGGGKRWPRRQTPSGGKRGLPAGAAGLAKGLSPASGAPLSSPPLQWGACGLPPSAS